MKKSLVLAILTCLAACTVQTVPQNVSQNTPQNTAQTTSAQAHTTSMTTASAAQLSGTKAAIFSAINGTRGQKGLAPLSYNQALARAAQNHADDMVAKGYFSHTSLSGTTATHRVKSTGYASCLTAENNSKSYPSAAAAFDGWMNSAPHRKNILNTSVREVGVGHGAGNMIVAVFAKPC